MRLWHKDLIHYLPRQQMLSQWRECCAIAKNLKSNGTPNHILVNKILRYPPEHFYYYTKLVVDEMTNRGYRVDGKTWKYFVRNLYSYTMNRFGCQEDPDKGEPGHIMHYFDQFPVSYPQIFSEWHTPRYLAQSLFNLEEKFDCGGIPVEEWNKIYTMFYI